MTQTHVGVNTIHVHLYMYIPACMFNVFICANNIQSRHCVHVYYTLYLLSALREYKLTFHFSLLIIIHVHIGSTCAYVLHYWSDSTPKTYDWRLVMMPQNVDEVGNCQHACIIIYMRMLMRGAKGRKKEASKVKQTNKAKQHNTPKAVTLFMQTGLHVDVHAKAWHQPKHILRNG